MWIFIDTAIKMKFSCLIALCIVLIPFAAAVASDEELASCENALTTTKPKSENPYWRNDVPFNQQIEKIFLRTLEEAIEIDDVVNTEAVVRNCAKLIEIPTDWDLLSTPSDWVINYAAERGSEKIVKMLLDNQLANVNAVDMNNYDITPLHWVARKSGSLRRRINPRSQVYVNIARMLIEHGANVSAQSEIGTPLQEAAKTGGEEIVKMLISKGANVNSRGKNNFTALHDSAEFNKANMTRLLIENGTEIDVKNAAGLTPFLYAAITGAKDVLKILIDAQADKNAQDIDGNTALHLIVEYRKSNNVYYAYVVRFLIENNVDRTIQNNNGKTACDLAKENEKTQLIPALGCEA